MLVVMPAIEQAAIGITGFPGPCELYTAYMVVDRQSALVHGAKLAGFNAIMLAHFVIA